MEHRNYAFCRGYADCLTLSYFFSKIVEQRAQNAVTLIELVSCVSHPTFGTALEKKTLGQRDTWDSGTFGTPGTFGTAERLFIQA